MYAFQSISVSKLAEGKMKRPGDVSVLVGFPVPRVGLVQQSQNQRRIISLERSWSSSQEQVMKYLDIIGGVESSQISQMVIFFLARV
jgi:hypothetical protein